MDCDGEGYGCNGGMYNTALDYVVKYGLESLKDYPYDGESGSAGTCKYN